MTQDASDSSRTFLQDVMDDIPEGLQVISHDWRYLYVNKSVAAQGKKTREELLGRTMMDCYPGIDKTPIFETFKRCKQEGKTILMDNEFTFPDGSMGWYQLHISPWEGGIMILSVDITDRKRRDEELSRRITVLDTLVRNPEPNVAEMQEIIRKMQVLIPGSS